jgi:hypothetical protein
MGDERFERPKKVGGDDGQDHPGSARGWARSPYERVFGRSVSDGSAFEDRVSSTGAGRKPALRGVAEDGQSVSWQTVLGCCDEWKLGDLLGRAQDPSD